MVEKNKEYILDIVSQGYEGEGVAKINDTFPVFIQFVVIFYIFIMFYYILSYKFLSNINSIP